MIYHIIYKSSSEMMSKLNHQAELDMNSSGAIEQTASSKGRYTFINSVRLHDDRSFMTPQRKRESANLVQESKSKKSQLFATTTSKTTTSEK
jgi:hypothetical protein